MDETKVFVYSGEGGNVINSEKCVNGNVALKNSFRVKNPIRVIMKFNSKNGGVVGWGEVYCYYGLYKFEANWLDFLIIKRVLVMIWRNERKFLKQLNVYILLKIFPMDKKLFLYLW